MLECLSCSPGVISKAEMEALVGLVTGIVQDLDVDRNLRPVHIPVRHVGRRRNFDDN